MDKEFRLTHDPVFQLNACLWLVRKSPFAVRSQKPVFAAEGFVLRALGQKLGVAAHLREAFLEAGWPVSSPEPDVTLRHVNSSDHLIIECKAHSFSPDSSTAHQGRKLLATCSAPGAAVGVSVDSSASAIVIYAVPSEDAPQQLTTLEKLTDELVEMEIPASKFGTLGLVIEDGGLWADLVIPNLEEDSNLRVICKRSWITDGDDQDARPIYLVPYDPTAADNQIPQEREYCARQLTQRILTYAMSVVGRADVPDSIRIMANDALKAATFDISDRWQAKELDKLRSRISQEIGSALNRGELKGKVDTKNAFVEVTLGSPNDQKIALALLDKSQDQYIAKQLIDDQMQVVDKG